MRTTIDIVIESDTSLRYQKKKLYKYEKILNKYGQLIEKDGAAEASRQLGVDKSSISKCLRGLKPQANGYKFVYYEREEENGIKDC